MKEKTSPLVTTTSFSLAANKTTYFGLKKSYLKPLFSLAVVSQLLLSGCMAPGDHAGNSGFLQNDIHRSANSATAPDWRLGNPDLILEFPQAYWLPAGESDVFRSFVIPNVSSTDRFVSAVDFKLLNHNSVHHAEFRIDKTSLSWQKDQDEAEPGFAGMGSTTARYPDGHFVNWVPGKQPTELPAELVWRLQAGADLVVQLHMMPSAIDSLIDPQIGLYFAESDASLIPEMIWLGSRWLPIAAGDSAFTSTDSFELPVGVEVMSMLPHCHYVCDEVNVWATLPQGIEKQLLKIEEWNFYKQEEFRFPEPLFLPAGTNISAEFRYDNSAENPSNPNSPPQDIQFGPRSADEMADLWIQVIASSENDSAQLRLSSSSHLENRIISGLERKIEQEPTVNLSLELATHYRAAGRLNDSLALLQESLEAEPENPAVVENLAIALADMGQSEDALEHWQYLVKLKPEEPGAQFNLAMAWAFSNQVSRAEVHLKRATELDPEFDSAFFQLGLLQSYSGKFDDALINLQSALALNPEEPMILRATARLLAMHPDARKRRPSEAIELANKALSILPDSDAWTLSTLAAAIAASGNFELATSTISQAIDKLNRSEERSIGARLQSQLHHYQQGEIESISTVSERTFVAPQDRRIRVDRRLP